MHLDQWSYLSQLYRDQTLPSFWIFSGTEESYQIQFAHKWIRYVLRIHELDCHPNLCMVDPEGMEKESIISKIRHFLLTTHDGFRILMIEKADKMNLHTVNALLKCFEESYKETMVILTTSMWHKLLPTIRSRFHRLHFHPQDHFPDSLKDLEPYTGGSLERAYQIHKLGGISWLETLKNHVENTSIPESFIMQYKEHAELILQVVMLLLCSKFAKTLDSQLVSKFELLNRFLLDLPGSHLNNEDILRTVFLLKNMSPRN